MQSGSSLRVHRRSRYLDGANWTIFTPRPSEPVRLATGVDDESVYVCANAASLEFLAQCLWAMAYQRHERTVFLFDRGQMVPNPTTGDLSRPVVVANPALGVIPPAMLDALRLLLPLDGPTDGTVKLRTAGLDRARADAAGFLTREAAEADAIDWSPGGWDDWVKREAGLVTVAMPPAVARAYARAAGEFGALGVGEPGRRRVRGPDGCGPAVRRRDHRPRRRAPGSPTRPLPRSTAGRAERHRAPRTLGGDRNRCRACVGGR